MKTVKRVCISLGNGSIRCILCAVGCIVLFFRRARDPSHWISVQLGIPVPLDVCPAGCLSGCVCRDSLS